MILWVRVFAKLSSAYFRTDVKTEFPQKHVLLLHMHQYGSIVVLLSVRVATIILVNLM